MINENFVFLAFVIALIGTFIYIRGILKGVVKPNIVTWSLWATAPMIAVAAQISEGASVATVYTFANGFGPLLIVIVALLKKNVLAKVKPRDLVFGVLSILGLVLWAITGEGLIAIIFAIAADLFAAIPTIEKLYKEPDTEDGRIFGLGIIAAGITLLTISDWRPEEYAFSLYILCIATVMFAPTFYKFLLDRKKTA